MLASYKIIDRHDMTYHEVFASVEVGEIIGVAIEDESLVVKVIFVSVNGVDEARSNGQTSDNGLPVRLQRFQGAANKLGVRAREKVSALRLGRAGKSRQFRGIVLVRRLEQRSRKKRGSSLPCS